ncbi:MAG: hypothetical protein HY720_05245 [Planctomycetes bacterium]|nr:hypothetical protein [Planctomycetota bacterium]
MTNERPEGGENETGARGPVLRVLEGEEAGRVIVLAPGAERTLGGEGSDEKVLAAEVGPVVRVAVSEDSSRVVVEDLTGRGVLVNHLKFCDRRLVDGDLFVAGDAVLLYAENVDLARASAAAGERRGTPGLLPVPRLFHSVYREGPFEECLVCSESLRAPFRQYFVEKVFRGREVILEAAICVPCMLKMQGEFSEESRERLEAFGRQRMGQSKHSFVRCDLCSAPRGDTGEMNLIGAFVGRWLVRDGVFLLCETCVLAIQELLSQKTRDVHREFLDDRFPGVPYDLDVPSPIFL